MKIHHGRGAQEPEWSGGVNLRYYEIPSPPDRGSWDATLIDNGFSVLHGISVTDWNRIPLDEGDMATSGLCAADLDSDGDIDIIAIGTSTGNIKWYENLTSSR